MVGFIELGVRESNTVNFISSGFSKIGEGFNSPKQLTFYFCCVSCGLIEMVTCYLGIGSNLGDRRKNIRLAISKIKALKDTKVIKLSRIIETGPVGGPPHQGKFLNAALKIKTKFPPHTLLKKLKQIEKELGRKKSLRYGPRTIDLDILFYGDRIINSKNLRIPHPKIFERKFVIKPLSEII